jgi:molybdopterin molybdotransferase
MRFVRLPWGAVVSSAPSGLLPVDTALERLLAGVVPLAPETVALAEASGRVLAKPLLAQLTQPPFNASAMDGYAVRSADIGSIPRELQVIAESAAGHPFVGLVGEGEAVRIFTGAALPAGADSVVIQEDVTRSGETVTVRVPVPRGDNVRAAGGDFAQGQPILAAGRRLTPRDLLVAAAAGHASLPVRRQPRIAILATGDELVPVGAFPGVGQIISSIPPGLAAMVRAAGAVPQECGIARDTLADLDAHITGAADADVLVTIGGASVGDHDLIGQALKARGLSLEFWKIAMRPGKPLLYGRLGEQIVLGLPGNPVSAMMCAHVFLMPLVAALQGCAMHRRSVEAILGEAIPATAPRRHYMRMRLDERDGQRIAWSAGAQDSSLVSVLAAADGLLILEPGAAALPAGSVVHIELLH